MRLSPPMQVLDLLKPHLDANAETCKRVCSWLEQLERYALTIGAVESLHLQNLSQTIAAPKGGQQPSFPPSELPARMPDIMAMGALSPTAWDMIRVAFYSLLRPGEYTDLRWDWIDLETSIITVPAETMNGFTNLLPAPAGRLAQGF